MGPYAHVTYRTWPRVMSQSNTHTFKENEVSREERRSKRTRFLERKALNPVEHTCIGCSASHAPLSLRTTFIISMFSFLRMVRGPGILSETDPKIGGKGFVLEDLGPKHSSTQSHKSGAPVSTL